MSAALALHATDLERAQAAAATIGCPTAGGRRLLAALVLVAGAKWLRADAAPAAGVAHPNQLAPSQWPRSNVTREMFDGALAAFNGSGNVTAAIPAPVSAPTIKPAKRVTSGKDRGAKTHTSTIRRFASADIDPGQALDLSPDHPAVLEGRSIFPKSVVGFMESPRFLVSGHNNPKLGKAVTKGPRTGWPIFQVTLEERATCPRSCPVWAGCYGNAMPYARRHKVDDDLIPALRGEVMTVARQHPEGLLIRLHTLGDFYSVEYVLMWAELLARLPQLHVFGYTARRVDDEDPLTRKIAQAIALLTAAMWERFAIRTSHAEFGPQRSVVVQEDPNLPDVIMCPAQASATEACATCGLCWAGAARGRTIGFLKHGMKRGARGRKADAVAAAPPDKAAPSVPPVKAPAQPPPQPAALAPGQQRLHDALIRLADDRGIVAVSREVLAREADLTNLFMPVERLSALNFVEVLRKGHGTQPTVYRVFGEPTKPGDRPAPPALPPGVREAAAAKAPAYRAGVRAAPEPARAVAERVRRMKDITDDIARWCSAYLARGVKLDYLADLFDVDEHDLARAVAQ